MPKTLLLLIDLQNDFLDAPRLEPHRDSVIAGAADLLRTCRARGIPVAHVWTTLPPDGSSRMPHWKERGLLACVEGTRGHAGPPSLRPLQNEPIFHKTWFSAFSVPGFENFLRQEGIEILIVAGLHLQTCLRQTALDAYQKGLRVCIARDASGSHEPLHGALTSDYLSQRAIPVYAKAALLARMDDGFASATEPHSSPSEMESLVAQARATQAAWKKRSTLERAKVLRSLATLLDERKEELAWLIVEAVKKPIFYARGELDRSAALLRAVAARAESFEETKMEAEGRIRHLPRGVIAMITPWNNPLAIPVGKLAPALVHGNAVIWKPAPVATKIAQALLPLLERAGIPPGLVHLAEGDERQAHALIAAGIDAVAFSGSSRTGWSIVAQSAARLLSLQAEMGGNNGAIICPDADLPSAAAAIAEGAFGFAGQRCTANRRVVVLAEIHEAFLVELEKATAALACGDPARLETRVSPMISILAAQTIAALVDRARGDGLRIVQPLSSAEAGCRLADDFHPPTLIVCDDPNSFIVQEESFGPILVVQKAADFEEALRLLNGVPYGLVAALFSREAMLQKEFLERAEAGILKLNTSTVNAGVDLPFIGWKHSGCGAAEHGEANAEFFTKRQSVYGWGER